MAKRIVLKKWLICTLIFLSVGALDEIETPWSRTALGYVSYILNVNLDFQSLLATAREYLSREFEAAWPDLAIAGISHDLDEVEPSGAAGSVNVPPGGGNGGAAPEPAMARAPAGTAGGPPAPAPPAVEESLPRQEQKTPASITRAPVPQHQGQGMLAPVNGTLVYGFGWRVHPIYKKRLFHDGVDIAAGHGTPIVAADSGIVIRAGNMGTYGLAVEVQHAKGISTLYAHCSRVVVKPGRRVSRGQKIGEVGSTGLSTGPHLHFEVRWSGKPVDPLTFVSRPSIEGR